jgi:hypothetical protein
MNRSAFTSSILTDSFTSLSFTHARTFTFMPAFLQAFSRPASQASACAPLVRRVSIRLMQSDGAILTTYFQNYILFSQLYLILTNIFLQGATKSPPGLGATNLLLILHHHHHLLRTF